jgi:hypothetical protein
MSKQNQAVNNQPEKQNHLKDRPKGITEQAEGQLPITSLSGSLLGVAANRSPQDQATRLADRRFLTVQRQVMTTQIGRVGGNQYLQRVMAQMKGDGQKEAIAEPSSDKKQEPNTSGVAQMAQDLEAQPFTPEGDVYVGEEKSSGNNEVIVPNKRQKTNGVVPGEMLQRKPNKKTAKELSAKLPLVQANARLVDTYYSLADNYINLSVVNTDMISTKLQIFAINYDMAYTKYANVIGQGRAEAQNQTLWRGIFLGIGTGVLAGLAAAYIAPSTAAGWFALTLADAGAAAGSSFLQATASSIVALALSDALTTRGSDLQPGGLSPDMLKSNIWQHVSSMYRGAFETNKILKNLHKNTVSLERTIAEMRVHIAGGASDYSAEDILNAATIMNDRVNGMKPVFDGLEKKSTAMSAFSKSVLSYDPTKPGVDQMEKDIWVMWVGSLKDDDSDILDLDAIEDHLKKIGVLGSGGLLGVDFGDYTSEDDELAAIAAARPKAATLKDQYDKTASQWNSPDTK